MIILTPNAKYRFEGRDDSDKNCDLDVIKETWVENVYHIERGDFYDTGVMIDLGANIGSVSVFAASLNDDDSDRFADYPDIKVYAFEPEPDNLRYLQKNIDAQGPEIERAITINPVAVGGYQGTVFIDSRQGNSQIHAESAPGRFEVPLITLQECFDDNRLKECDVLKMDIEGAEFEVIRGASIDTLKRIKYLTMEFTGVDEGAATGDFGEMVTKLAHVFNLHVLGSPERGGYITGRRY